ncbi:hypothetical protein N658DRAFT_491136 [Parathielavia hyrcaniae]|uniref:Uncharacterized protein n=1 Tax=Parathielavia hyrcaniae TaxID=113614 RepID=A0AAN6QA81_9PEZI|nr:hypothetical protein N658DRAFT_491136 [Parathielavia hyrcaniae]
MPTSRARTPPHCYRVTASYKLGLTLPLPLHWQTSFSWHWTTVGTNPWSPPASRSCTLPLLDDIKHSVADQPGPLVVALPLTQPDLNPNPVQPALCT